jgi:acetyl esterase/lipase
MPTYRRIFAAGTARFMSSLFVRTTLSELHGNFPDKHDVDIGMRDGVLIVARIYRPTGSCPRPVMVMAHGGGFCMGGLDTEEFICQLLCRSLDLVVVSVAYRLCPEVSYPTPVLDVYDAVKWVAKNASTFGGDLKLGFLLGGISGGGNLTTGVCYLARDEALHPPLTGSMLSCTGMPHDTEDRHGNVIDLYPGSCPSWKLLINDAPLSNYETVTRFRGRPTLYDIFTEF